MLLSSWVSRCWASSTPWLHCWLLCEIPPILHIPLLLVLQKINLYDSQYRFALLDSYEIEGACLAARQLLGVAEVFDGNLVCFFLVEGPRKTQGIKKYNIYEEFVKC